MTDLAASDVVTVGDVEAAHDRLADVVHRTPLDTSTTFAERSGADAVGLKLENMQRTGSFKIRGAYNTMSQLSDAERERGVIAASAGNHAQGVALAGDLLGIDTTIVVPEVTPAAKIEATRGYGADVVVEGDIYERSYEHALERMDDEGLTFVHPFNDEGVIAGQGTVGLELHEQFPSVETVVVSIGGGGLISGMATVLEAYDPSIRVVGVQPEGAAHAAPSLERDEIYELADVDTVAEGIADTRLLEKTFAVMRDRVDRVVSVSDTELCVASTLLAERAKTVVETAGAAPLAAILSGAVDVAGEAVGVVVSGGNVDLSAHADVVRTGLVALDRYVEVAVDVDDWPTAVGQLTRVVDDCGGTLDVLERAPPHRAARPNRTPVTLGVEGSGASHLQAVVEAIDDLETATVTSHTLE